MMAKPWPGSIRTAQIDIHRIHGGKWTLAHETTHWLEDSGLLSPMDVSILRNYIKRLAEMGKFTPENSEMSGGAEDRANFIADRLNEEHTGAVARIMAKVRDFIDRLVNLVKRTAGGVVRDVKSGKIFEGQGKERTSVAPAYALARKTPVATPKTDALLASLPQNVQERLDLSAGLGQTTFAQKAKDVADRIRKTFTRHHVTLDAKTYGDVADLIRQLEEVPQIATRKATGALVDITKDLKSKDNLKLFTYSLVMDDMIKDMEPGGILDGAAELPFGLTEQQARSFHAQVKAEAAKSPEVQKALTQRRKSMRELLKRLVSKKLLPADTLRDSRYFHHQVLLHRAAKEMGADYQSKPGLSTQDARMHKKGWQIARKGSIEDYNTEYFESEFEVLAQAEAQLKTAEILGRIQDSYDQHGDLVAQAKADNIANLWKTLRAQGLIQKDKNGNEIDPLLPWKMKTAMANGKLGEMADKGQLVFDPQYSSLVRDLADSYRSYVANKKGLPG